MAFPAELSFENEDDFIQKFLIPLLNRLGYSVVNYHGTREFGRDLIFAEFDRLGDIRYHGMQAKYVASISQKDSHGLVEDCKEAFANPFKHPHTGAEQRISTFYAVNAGDISETARTNFFNSLVQYGSNVILKDGKSLVALDRSAAATRGEFIREVMMGLILEIRINRRLMVAAMQMWEPYTLDQKKPLPLEPLRGFAVSSYLARPVAAPNINVTTIINYATYVESYREVMDFCNRTSSASWENKKDLLSHLKDNASNFYLWGNEIETQASQLLSQLGPITGL